MRTNKFIPFYVALAIHLIPIIYFLSKKPASFQPTAISTQGIGLSHFSLSKKSQGAEATKTVKYPHSNGPVAKLAEASEGGGTKAESSEINSNQLKINSGSSSDDKNNENNKGPIFISFTEPTYPPIAREKNYEGKVKIEAFYNNEGSIIKIIIIQSSGIKMLDEAVKKVAYNWKLSTASAGHFEKSFEFKLNN